MQPPKSAIRLLRWFCREDYLEELEGDLTELFRKESERSPFKAKATFSWRVIKYFRPGFIRSFTSSNQSTGMLKNYFTIARRNLFTNKSFSSLNIVGLSIGMTCCLIIFQYVAFESSFDRFHTRKDNLYRVLQSYARGEDPMENGHAYTAQSLSPALKEGVPEIVNVTRVHSENAIVFNPVTPERIFEEDAALYVDNAFMDMFTFPMVSGSKALSAGTVLLSEAAAKKYFGNAPAEGQTLDVTGNTDKTYTVGGVFKNIPENSHLQFTMLLPMEDLLKGPDYSTEPEGGWSWNNFTTYLELHPDADRAAVKRKMTEVFVKHRGDALKEGGSRGALNLQSFHDIHLNADVMGAGSIVAGNYKTLYFFLVIGVITLVIALVNYINLATARALNRSREVGVRKAVGARRTQLVVQFLYESAFTNVSAMILALLLTLFLLPFVNDIAETKLSIAQWLEPIFLMSIGITLFAGTLLAGLYPAFVLSSFRPAAVLKGRTSSVSAHLALRKGLVVVQFAACIILIAGTVIVLNQLRYMRTIDLGLNLEHLVSLQSPRLLPDNVDRPTLMNTFMHEVKQLAGVDGAAMSSTLPGQGFNWNGASMRKVADDKTDALQGVATYIDSAFAPLYGLKLIAGKEFRSITAQEDATEKVWVVMINETAAKNLGFPTPAYAVDELLMIGDYQARIIGVYKDFKWSSAHQQQKNIVFGRTSAGSNISIRIDSQDVAGTINKIEKLYATLFPGNLFHYSFVDDNFDLQYRNDQRFARLFSIFAGMSIFIACLGLFGLVAFTAQQRTKEIGIRKVLGASVNSVVALLCRDFIILIGIAIVIATPVAWWSMSRWLESFAYRIEIHVWIFLLAGLLAIVIAAFTISLQALKVARSNPVNSLRSE